MRSTVGIGVKVMITELDINLLPNAPAARGQPASQGVSDADSWLNRGRMNYPLLWDRQRQPKPAFDAVVNVLKEK